MKTIALLKQSIIEYSCMLDCERNEHIRNVNVLIIHLSAHINIYPGRKFYHCSNCICGIPHYIKNSTIHILRLTDHSETEISYILEKCITDYAKELKFFTIP